MKVMVLGVDGYLGWTLALRLEARGHEVQGIDNFSRRHLVARIGSRSALPMLDPIHRAKEKDWYSAEAEDLTEYHIILQRLKKFKPDSVVHLAEQPSAPYSMRGVRQAVYTQQNNVIGTLNVLYAMKEVCPEAHLLKLGTMGEYGTPDCVIPEGSFPKGSNWTGPDSRKKGKLEGMMFPRRGGSWYHLSKIHDTHNIKFACDTWGLRSTDVMQGVVYGTRTEDITEESLHTRFDIDSDFGTCLNRFCSQAVIGMPLTVYGLGNQTRGFLPLQDSIQCLTIAIEKPPEPGEYRVFNQFEETYTINQLAMAVQRIGSEMGLDVEIQHVPNPRVELEQHPYEVVHQKLFDLGYKPTNDLHGQIKQMLEDLLPHQKRIMQARSVLMPKVNWR